VRMSFDGGSRGNPGHTGAGSVIMEASDGAEWNTHGEMDDQIYCSVVLKIM
jgi:hypothetical protein